MSKVSVFAGICGFKTVIKVELTSKNKALVKVESDCQHVKRMAKDVGEVDIMTEIFRREKSRFLSASKEFLPHITCPVSVGILKALEVSAGLALPKDVSINFCD